ncbi:hypothetical protein AGOR_G00060370 [Albula goreensis]|uniref:Uncharacterized protein n=1 Tax=Albula goreensis TaxID=1534307 RepID=A0A8T3DPC2_9TELE|nr:hypothetical protein AGOR_G00060370 [Albula goreensis]
MMRALTYLLGTGFFLASCTRATGQQEALLYTYHTVVGQFFQLECDINLSFVDTERNLNITWSRNNNQSLDVTTSRVRMWNVSLLFFPVEFSDSGFYTCKQSRGSFKRKEIKMFLSVESGSCPGPSDTKTMQQGSTRTLTCRQEHVFTLDHSAEVSWLKDCTPMEQQGKFVRISNATSSNTGSYTCQINFTFEGKTFTTSRSTLLIVQNAKPVLVEPKVIYPREETIQVELGAKAELNCTAFIGMRESTEIESSVYWTVNYSFVEFYTPPLNQSLQYVKKNSKFYGVSRLFIAEVHQEFFHVPFHCVVTTPMGRDLGLVWLSQAANQRDYHALVAICVAVLVVVAAVVIYRMLKVDAVLAYRRLCCSALTERDADGKLYDGYVSFLHEGVLSSSRAEEFCLQVLPEVLEVRHGYRLFINGRDSLPEEGAPDIITDTISRSRRLILVLSGQNQADQDRENLLLWDRNQNRPDLGQLTTLCEAMIQSGVQVILLETDKHIDYSLLPQPLRYAKQKHGALRWRLNCGDPTAPPNSRFWKCLLYRMPP